MPRVVPSGYGQGGYTWHDILASKKMPDVSLRRVKLNQVNGEGQAQVFTIVPSFVMPYMSGYTDEVEKALFFAAFWCALLGYHLSIWEE